MTTILFFAFVALGIYCRIWLWRIARYDRMLFPFCQLRRDMMRFLREHMPNESNALTRKEYESTLRLLEVLSTIIHNYSQHKTTLFNLRKVAKLLRKYRDVMKKIEPIQTTENKQIQIFHNRFAVCSAKAFLAYTPLIRSEVVLRICVFMYRAASEKVRKSIISGAEQVRKDLNIDEATGMTA